MVWSTLQLAVQVSLKLRPHWPQVTVRERNQDTAGFSVLRPEWIRPLLCAQTRTEAWWDSWDTTRHTALTSSGTVRDFFLLHALRTLTVQSEVNEVHRYIYFWVELSTFLRLYFFYVLYFPSSALSKWKAELFWGAGRKSDNSRKNIPHNKYGPMRGWHVEDARVPKQHKSDPYLPRKCRDFF